MQEDDLYLNLRLYKKEQEIKKQLLIDTQMSKPDFFLPFHLPIVLDDTNVLNIDCKPFYYDHPLSGINSKYFCQSRYDELNKKAMQKIIIPLRLKCGVYQTIKTRLGYMAFNPTIKLFPFSISLN